MKEHQDPMNQLARVLHDEASKEPEKISYQACFDAIAHIADAIIVRLNAINFLLCILLGFGICWLITR